jgi:dsRNA-specific ribonuclease
VEVRLEDGHAARGRAPSKRAAQQRAAEALLARLGGEG